MHTCRKSHYYSTGALPAVALTLVLAACGGGTDTAAGGGQFDPGTAELPLRCMGHQSNTPGPAYTAGDNGGDTAAIFAMLRYYTANKAVTSYCDGKTATPTDRRWAQLYVKLGAAPANVAHILS